MEDDPEQRRQSLLPYDDWTETALRQVVVRALAHVEREGLPGGHHFYLTFRTDHPAVALSPRLRAQYPREMTIVLQNQFWDLKVDEAAGEFSVGLSFAGVPATLTIPFAAITAFVDPEVQYGLRFSKLAAPPAEAGAPAPAAGEEAPQTGADAPAGEASQVVSLDAFRRRPSPGPSSEEPNPSSKE
jgi:hypothetical protein